MATKLYIKLQTPTIELLVKAKDVSGAKESMLVGFKRYETITAQEKLTTLQDLLADAQANNLNSSSLDKFIKEEIVYIKQAKLELYDEVSKATKDLLIQDTRTAKPNDGLWETSEQCLDVLLDLYLSSAPWRLSLILMGQKALLNNDYSEAEVKN